MRITGQRYKADNRLSGIVSHFYGIRLPAGAAETYHLAPNLEMMLVFNFGAPVSFSTGESSKTQPVINKVAILGPIRRMMSYTLMAGADLLVVNFTHNGLYRLLSLPIESFESEDFSGRKTVLQMQRLEKLRESLSQLADTKERISLLTPFFVNEIARNEEAALPLLDSVPYFYTPAVSPVKMIAAQTLLTERTIQLRFKKYVGYSPKELIRFLRFKQVLLAVLAQSPKEVDWFQLVNQYGYHDQSHLIKDFKYYTGVSPKQFFKLNDDGSFCMNSDAYPLPQK